MLNRLLLFSLLIPVQLFSQDITGLWKGALYNDSTQTYFPYEIAISENNGKFSGYSETIFTIAGKDEIGIKSLKIWKENEKILLEDIDLVANTYSIPPPKGVRKLSILTLTVNDTSMIMKGHWSTNRTKKYLPGTGTLELKRKADFKEAPLFKQLEALKLAEGLSFNPVIKKAEPVIVKIDHPKASPERVVVKKSPKEKPKPITPEKKPLPVVAVRPTIPPPAAEVATRKIANIQSDH